MVGNSFLVNTPAKIVNTEMTADDYKVIQQFLSKSCGIVLGENKQYLVKNRLLSLLSQYNLTSFSELAAAIQMTNKTINQKIRDALVDAMTTNETSWFRDDLQFEELKQKILPECLAKKNGTIKIWSAACSTGQEPYTLSMCVEDTFKKSGASHNVQIVGTDISETVLTQAKTAIYSEMALSRGLDAQTKNRFFQKTEQGYQLNAQISQRVRLQQFNLLSSFSGLGRFDVIFCRNVLIYFSDEVKRDILKRMAGALEPGGYVFLSSTESMPIGQQDFESVRNGKARYFKKIP